jgi:hypothetical protein
VVILPCECMQQENVVLLAIKSSSQVRVNRKDCASNLDSSSKSSYKYSSLYVAQFCPSEGAINPRSTQQ